MFITQELLKSELKEEDCWLELSPKEKKMFLEYATNGMQALQAYEKVYIDEESDRVVKFPGKKANAIVAKNCFQECINLYAELIKEHAMANTNAQLFNTCWHLAFYNVFDFINEDGSFKFESVEEAKEILGIKALAITGIETTMHPKFPDKTITTVKFINRQKYMDYLTKVTKFLGEESGAGTGMGQVIVNAQMASFNPEDDEVNRKRYGLE